MIRKNENGFTATAVIIFCIIAAIILLLFETFVVSMMKYNEIKQYKYIVIDGEKHKTSEVEDVQKDLTHEFFNNDSMYIITMKDGTVYYTEQYSLKLRK